MNTNDIDTRAWSDDDLDLALIDLLTLAHTTQPAAHPPALRSRRRRLLLPVAAAAAVAAIAVAAIGIAQHHQRVERVQRAAAAVSVADGTADVGGVRFPLPDGWTVAVTTTTDDAVTACAAQHPANPCDGVTLTIALPDGPPLDAGAASDVSLLAECAGGGGIIQVETDIDLGGRRANHYFGGACTADGPAAHLWVLLDNSMAITTLHGKWADQGALIASGLDLSHWTRPPGAQMLFWTSATSAGPTG